MIFILTKLAVENYEYKDIQIYDDIRDAISSIHDICNDLDEDEYECKIIRDCRVEIYKKNKGYFVDDITLEFIVEILEYDSK